MNRPPLHVVTIPRIEACTGKTVWDGESAVLRATFEAAPSAAHATAETLREQFDEALRIRKTPPRLVVGDVDIAYRDEWHIDSIEFRTNPATWQKESLDDVTSEAAPAWIVLDVEYDDNGIFTLDVPIVVRWDAVASRLAVRFGVSVARNWYRIADSVVAGTSTDGALAELRFSAAEIVGAQPSLS